MAGELKTADKLRFEYLSVFTLLMLADWLQGTNMYTLYQSYGVDVGTLFLTGFCTSAVCGTFVGSFVDYVGRRNGCIVYCVLEIVIQGMEHINNFWVLFLGRIIGGLTTSLLFSAFESWLVASHRSRGLGDGVLRKIFSEATIINGIVAILAGLIARVAFLQLGDIGPFQTAAALTFAAMCLILALWDEPAKQALDDTSADAPPTGLDRILHLAWKDATKTPATIALGVSCALFEGAMYTFVFMWVPVLQMVSAGVSGRAPTELVFSCMMVCVALGGVVYKKYLAETPMRWAGLAISAVAAASMLSCAISLSFLSAETARLPVLASFLVFEATVGAFQPWSASARSVHFPPRVLTTVMNLFRVPLNAIVVFGVYLAEAWEAQTVFLVCFCFHAAAFGIKIAFFSGPDRIHTTKND